MLCWSTKPEFTHACNICKNTLLSPLEWDYFNNNNNLMFMSVEQAIIGISIFHHCDNTRKCNKIGGNGKLLREY